MLMSSPTAVAPQVPSALPTRIRLLLVMDRARGRSRRQIALLQPGHRLQDGFPQRKENGMTPLPRRCR